MEPLRAALDAIPSGVALLDDSLRYLAVNRSYARLLDLPPGSTRVGGSAADGLRLQAARGDLGPGEPERLVQRALAELRASEQRRVERALPSGATLEILTAPAPDGGVAVVVSDITELKRAERAQSSIARNTLDTIDQGIVLVDEHMSTVTWNRHFMEMFSLPERLLSPAPNFHDLLRYWVESNGLSRELLDKAIANTYREEPLSFVQPQPDGRILEIRHLPREDGWFVRTFADVTERTKAERALEEKSAQLNLALESMQEGMIVLDADLCFLFHNRRTETMLDAPGELFERGKPLEGLVRYFAEQGRYGPGDVETQVEQRLEAYRRFRTEAQFRTSDGRVLQITRGRTADDGVVSVLRDVTEQRRLEERLRAARDEAERALAELKRAQAELVRTEKMASLGALTAGIAHEIKNPLNFVNNFAETSVELLEELAELLAPLLQSAESREDIVELIAMLRGDLAAIASHGRRADDIMRQMLMHARDRTDERSPTDLNALVQSSLKLAYHGERARDPGFAIELETSLDEAVGEVPVAAQDITRVLVNLFSNGFYAARERERESGAPGVLRVATRALDATVAIEVWDNGTGIPAAVMEKLFTPFFTTKPVGEGTGLGLSLSYDIIVQAHAGRIDVEAEEGRFTRFTITLPRGAAGGTA